MNKRIFKRPVAYHTSMSGDPVILQGTVHDEGLRDHFLAIGKLATPLAATNLAMSGLTLTDMAMTAWLGVHELAAVTLAQTIYTPLMFFGTYLISSVAPILSQMRGRQSVARAPCVVAMALWLVTGFSLPCVAALIFGYVGLASLGFDLGLVATAGDYLATVAPGLLPLLWLVALRNFAAAFELPKAALWVYFAALPINALLNFVFMFGAFGAPALGAMGLGIATSIVNLLMFLAMLGYCLFTPKLPGKQVLRALTRFDGPAMKEIVSIGLPIALGILVDAGMFAVATLFIAAYGAVALAAHAVARQCRALSYQVILGLGQAVTIRTGFAAGVAGAGKTVKVLVGGTILCVFWLVLSGGLFLFFGEEISRLFLTSEETSIDAITLTTVFLAVAALTQVADAGQMLLISVLRGLKDTRIPTLIQLCGYWVVGVPMQYTFAHWLGWGSVGVWFGLTVGLASVAAVLVLRYRFVLNSAPVSPLT